MKCRLEPVRDSGPAFRMRKSDIGYERQNRSCNRYRRHFSSKRPGAMKLDRSSPIWGNEVTRDDLVCSSPDIADM